MRQLKATRKSAAAQALLAAVEDLALEEGELPRQTRLEVEEAVVDGAQVHLDLEAGALAAGVAVAGHGSDH